MIRRQQTQLDRGGSGWHFHPRRGCGSWQTVSIGKHTTQVYENIHLPTRKARKSPTLNTAAGS